MGDILENVRDAIQKTGARAKVIEALGAEVVERLGSRFARHEAGSELWERLDERISHRDPEAWRWISEYVSGHGCLLVFPPRREAGAVEFEDGAELTRVLEQCFGFELYVTDAAQSYLLCFNHHDFLIAAGEARAWLRQRMPPAA